MSIESTLGSAWVLALAGALLGLLSATVTESAGHKFTGHPGRLQRKLYLRFPRVFAAFLKPYYQHLVIHHHRTFKGEFFSQFQNEKEKADLDRWITNKFSVEFAELVQVERYNLTLKGFSGTIPFALPFLIGPALIAVAFGTIPFMGSLLTAFIPVWLSKFVHPLIHLPEETAQAHPFVRWLMRTHHMRRVFRNHYLHHQEQETNFNLLLGGDYLIGLHRDATQEERTALMTLEPEFTRRVNLKLALTNEKFDASPFGGGRPQVSLSEFLAHEGAYVALENPTFEQRFSHMMWTSKAFAAAQANSQLELLALRDAGATDFGMKLYDKDIHPAKWSEFNDFSLGAYSQSQDGVRYRGIEIQTGDILLTNQSSDSDGLFSTLLEGQINFSHVALFCMIELQNQIYPAVVEINEGGVRAVPLKVFLSRKFNSYVEVFRPRMEITESKRQLIAKAAMDVIEETHAFDIYQDESQDTYLNCARSIALIYRKAGLASIPAKSFYSPKTFANLKTLGIHESAGKTMLMPDDYAKSPEFFLIGTIDNGEFESVVARGLMRGQIQKIWQTSTLDRAEFPLEYRFYRWFVSAIQNNTRYAPFLLRVIGTERARFVSGPTTFISLIPIANRNMELGTRKIRAAIRLDRQWLYSFSSWHSLISDKKVREILEDASADFKSLYTRKSVVAQFGSHTGGDIERRATKEKVSGPI